LHYADTSTSSVALPAVEVCDARKDESSSTSSLQCSSVQKVFL